MKTHISYLTTIISLTQSTLHIISLKLTFLTLFSLPPSLGKLRWDLLLGFWIIYSTIMVPLRIGFSLEAEGVSSVIDLIGDIFFFLDIVVNFLTGYVDAEGYTIWDFKIIGQKYLRGWFMVDFLSTFPFDEIGKLALGGGDAGVLLQSSKLLKVLRLIRLLKLMRLIKLGKLVLYFRTLEEKTDIDLGFLQLFKLMSGIIFLNHIIGCLYMFCGENAESDVRWFDGVLNINSTISQNYTVRYEIDSFLLIRH
jgi:hypothetical protein